MSDLPPYAREWLRQRQIGANAVEQVERRELAELSDEDALRQSEALLSLIVAQEEEESERASRSSTSGFVEQQRIFLRYLERKHR